jgi:lysozyme family protein
MPDLFPYAISYVFSNETYITHSGVVVSLYSDDETGEYSNWGISLKFLKSVHPDACKQDILNLTEQTASDLACEYFWNPAHLDLITLPTIAARVFDMEFNSGPSQGVRLLQKALNVTADGILGPATAKACNSSPELTLYAEFVEQAKSHYQAIHDKQITEYGQQTADSNLSRWLARLAKMPLAYAG